VVCVLLFEQQPNIVNRADPWEGGLVLLVFESWKQLSMRSSLQPKEDFIAIFPQTFDNRKHAVTLSLFLDTQEQDFCPENC